MKIETKKDLDQALIDAERIKAIVDSGELATDTEVVLLDSYTDSDEIIDKSSEQVVEEYLGEIELNHKEDDKTEGDNSAELFSKADESKDNLDVSDSSLPLPSETNQRPFLKGPKSETMKNGTEVLPPNTYYGADPSVSLMG